LIRKYGHLGDELFAQDGYREYAEDLLERITNPYLADAVARAGRDVVRKLGRDDRIFGTMRLAIGQGIEPVSMAVGALAGIGVLLRQAEQYSLPGELRCEDWQSLDEARIQGILCRLWDQGESEETQKLASLVHDAGDVLSRVLG
jgi:mannitol-1-phosphate/altronate dehydrogenase